jgi:Iron dependent repressor, N-terminal DNA binding domain.
MHESGEMYLETILILGKRNNPVRAVDISDEMHISKASVSRALTRLKHEDCIVVDNKGHIDFTEKGRKIAEKFMNGISFLRIFLLLWA